jgi:hypothetical protein
MTATSSADPAPILSPGEFIFAGAYFFLPIPRESARVSHVTNNANQMTATTANLIQTATIEIARQWQATADKAAFTQEFLGFFSINSPGFSEAEDAAESRFEELLA